MLAHNPDPIANRVDALPTITGRDFLVLSDDWEGMPTSTIHLFRYLNQENRVFWFRVINRLPQMQLADCRKVMDVVSAWCRPRRADRSIVRGKLEVPIQRTPWLIPYFTKPVRSFNHWSLRRTFQNVCDSYNLRDPILFTTFPATADFVGTARAYPKIYYCVDDWSCYPGLDHQRLSKMEDDLIERVDGVVVTSRKLEAKIANRRPTLYLPQGVDFFHFNDALQNERIIDAMEKIPKPIVGFFGLLSEWVDLDVISYVADRFPKVSFVFIGATDIPKGSVPVKPNIYWIGKIAYEELPHWARYFDVAIIPFKINDLTKAVNPLKLMEYFALGLPVVSMYLPELQSQPGPVRLAYDAREFADELASVLATTTQSDRHEAIRIASEQTWAHRLGLLTEFITSL